MSRQDQQARAASNQSFFREVNEQVETLAPATAAFVEFICESARQECAELVSLTMEECEDVRRESNRFFVLRGMKCAQ
jgi:hypothetical protein